MKQKQAELFFEEIYKKTYSEAYGYILAKTGDINETPELLRKSYVDYYRHLLRSNTKETHAERNRVFKFIQKYVNQYYNSQPDVPEKPKGRKIKRYVKLLDEHLNSEIPPFPSKQELNQSLQDVLTKVSSKSIQVRRAFIMYYFFDFTFEQIAKELSITEEDAGNHIYLLTKEIKKDLERIHAAQQE